MPKQSENRIRKSALKQTNRQTGKENREEHVLMSAPSLTACEQSKSEASSKWTSARERSFETIPEHQASQQPPQGSRSTATFLVPHHGRSCQVTASFSLAEPPVLAVQLVSSRHCVLWVRFEPAVPPSLSAPHWSHF